MTAASLGRPLNAVTGMVKDDHISLGRVLVLPS